MTSSDYKTNSKNLKNLGAISVYISRGIAPKYSSGGIQVLNQKCVRGGRVRPVDIKFHNQTAAYPKEKRILRGDILINSTGVGTLGRVAFVDQEICAVADSHLTIVRVDPEQTVPQYVFYYLHSIQDRIADLGQGTSGQQELSREQVRRIEIPLQSMSEQKRIASTLAEMDRQIDVQQDMNLTLEAIGQAIFKRWFVDFEFPNEQGKPYKSSGGEMVDSELGKIPKGWAIHKLGDQVQTIKGCSYASTDLQDSESALVTLKSITRGGGFNEDGFKPFIGKFKKEQELSEDDLVVAHTDITQNAEVLGQPALIRSTGGFQHLIASLDLSIIRPKCLNSKFYVYYSLKETRFQEHAYGYSNGSTVLHLSSKAVPEYLIIIPAEKILNKFNELIRLLNERIKLNAREIRNLQTVRDALLPKLMSGKVRIVGEE